jgi:ParB family chromosome partitioning protein
MRVLGKGLSQLIGEEADSSLLEVPVSAIEPNARQPRTHFNDEALQELAGSIREVGILQPLVVRPVSDGHYELIAGERRLRAAKLAGLTKVPVVVRAAGEMAMLEIALIENLQREDISAVESARAYKRFIDEFGLTQEAVADKVGKSRVAVANTLRLLKLSPRILEGLEGGAVTEGHARALLGLPNEAAQLAVYDEIVRNGLTVKQVERLATLSKEGTKSRSPKRPSSQQTDPNWLDLQERMSMRFGLPTKLERTAGNAGRIVVDFYSEDDLSRIVEILNLLS